VEGKLIYENNFSIYKEIKIIEEIPSAETLS
jgi:hypothetical protein